MANGRTGTVGNKKARDKATRKTARTRTGRKTRRWGGGDHALDLYTFQPYDAIERAFATDGVYQATRLDAYRDGCLNDDEGDVFANAYRWLIGEMLRAGIMPHPLAAACGRANATGNAGTATMRTVADIDAAGITPVWAWARWTDDHNRPRSRPDRRCYAFRATGDLKAHLIHLRIPASRVMLSDSDDWHCVLNRAPAMPPESRDWDEARVDRWLDEHWEDPIEVKRRQWRENVLIPTGHEPMGIMDDAPGASSDRVSDDAEDRAWDDASDCAQDCASPGKGTARVCRVVASVGGMPTTAGVTAGDALSDMSGDAFDGSPNGRRTIDSTADLMALPNFWVQATFWWIEPADIVRVWQPPR